MLNKFNVLTGCHCFTSSYEGHIMNSLISDVKVKYINILENSVIVCLPHNLFIKCKTYGILFFSSITVCILAISKWTKVVLF